VQLPVVLVENTPKILPILTRNVAAKAQRHPPSLKLRRDKLRHRGVEGHKGAEL